MSDLINSAPVQRGSIPDGIVKSLVSFILEEGLTPGDKLPSERELMKRLSVGRSSLREAISVLGALGIIEVAAGSGMFVANGELSLLTQPLSWRLLMSERSTRDVIDTRRAVEVELAGLAAERATDEDIAALDERLHLMRASEHDQTRALTRYDLEFHMAVSQAAHSGVLHHVMSTLRQLLHVWFYEVSIGPPTFEQRIARHTAIRDAIRAHDAVLARELMAEHLDSGAAWLIEAVTGAQSRKVDASGQGNGGRIPE